ncbi:OprD family outer membrane porin [Shewanella sp. JM162201]|uniref:OprD family outer membrane porin n=1 Tax=Shewanella jiangmenensis TaxID=2837387 RepID=A0ABS5UY08_9GAMM|nr:OprD family outer membrane porin [Shewanella jiangmenensis]MBT1442930.1 OprD family outer membrane porin [Shewanella jiangmenensis]
MATRNPLLVAWLLSTAVAAPATAFAQQQVSNGHDHEPNQQNDVTGISPEATQETEKSSFFGDSSLVLKPRSYYLDRDRDTKADSVGWALGGALEYKSGWLSDWLRFNATVYTSQKLYGPEDEDGTGLFKPGPESFTVLGEANFTVRFAENHGLRIGRQRFELPYLGSHDIRMTPNTFEGVAIGNTSPQGFGYMAGYVDKIKGKSDDEFVSMSHAAGAKGTDEGLGFAGARYVSDAGTTVGAIYQRTFDTFDTVFAKVEHPFEIIKGSTINANLQYTGQQSQGDELIGAFDTSMWAAKVELKHGPYAWRFGASTTEDDHGIIKPFGNPANYLSVIVDDFDRAGEDAYMLGFSMNFGRVGPGDMSAFANIVHGDTPETGPAASADETEYDLTLDWRLKEGWSERIWLRARAAYIDQDNNFASADDFLDFRIIVNYDFTLL